MTKHEHLPAIFTPSFLFFAERSPPHLPAIFTTLSSRHFHHLPAIFIITPHIPHHTSYTKMHTPSTTTIHYPPSTHIMTTMAAAAIPYGGLPTALPL